MKRIERTERIERIESLERIEGLERIERMLRFGSVVTSFTADVELSSTKMARGPVPR